MIEDDAEQTILINEAVTFTLSESLVCKLKQSDKREFTLRFDSLESDLLPQVLQFKFYPQTGKIMLMDNKKVYAALFKNAIRPPVTKRTSDANF